MRTEIVDGNDVVAVRVASEAAIAYAREGSGPAFIECKTVRWERHSAFSAGGTDQDAARAAWQRVDPLQRFRRELDAWGIAGAGDLDSIDSSARAEAAGARAQAEAAPRPAPESVYEDLFAPAK